MEDAGVAVSGFPDFILCIIGFRSSMVSRKLNSFLTMATEGVLLRRTIPTSAAGLMHSTPLSTILTAREVLRLIGAICTEIT